MAKRYVDHLLGEREEILLIAHQHWFILIEAIYAELIFFFVVVVLAALATGFLPVMLPVVAPFIFLVPLVALILLLIPTVSLVREVLDWYNREYVVTNLRVIQLSGVVNKNVTDSSLEKVNDVKMEQTALGRIFDYGNIEILTASELGVNLFRRIKDPIKFKTVMLNAKERLEHEGLGPRPGHAPAAGTVPDIPAMIAQLDTLRQNGVLTEEEFQAKKRELLAKM